MISEIDGWSCNSSTVDLQRRKELQIRLVQKWKAMYYISWCKQEGRQDFTVLMRQRMEDLHIQVKQVSGRSYYQHGRHYYHTP